MSVGAIAGERAFTELFDPASEFDVGHIRLARDNDLIVVAPATADLMAKMANGHADDLASAVLLATDKRVLIAPAMNPRMWANKATQRNVKQLIADGVLTVGPNSGEMAESGEAGIGRMAEPLEIVAAIEKLLQIASDARTTSRSPASASSSRRARPTSRSIRCATSPTAPPASRATPSRARRRTLGAKVTLVSGPVTLPDPPGVKTVRVESARDMLGAVEAALPADVGVFAAAVADWRTADAGAQKMKKDGSGPPRLELVENPDILARVSKLKTKRPTARDRLRGRDREGDRARHGQAEAQRLRLDRRERRVGGRRRDGRRRQRGASRSRRTASSRGRRNRRTTWREISSRASRRRWASRMNDIAINVMRLPHGADLPLPVLSERRRGGPRPARRGAGGCAAHDCARAPRRGADRHRDRAARQAPKRRCGRARGLRAVMA